MLYLSKDGILGHKFNKRLETFAPCYSQSPSTGGFLKRPYSPVFPKIFTKKIYEKRILGSIHEKRVLERKNEGTKPDNT